jgi:hypothetical protein
VRRTALAAVLAAAFAAVSVAVAGTFSATTANTSTLSSQTVFPPLNTSAPTLADPVGVWISGVTVLTANVGTWAKSSTGTNSFSVQFQRCSGGTCSNDGSPITATDLGGGVLGALYTVAAGDIGSGVTVRVVVTGTNSVASPTASETATSNTVTSG